MLGGGAIQLENSERRVGAGSLALFHCGAWHAPELPRARRVAGVGGLGPTGVHGPAKRPTAPRQTLCGKRGCPPLLALPQPSPQFEVDSIDEFWLELPAEVDCGAPIERVRAALGAASTAGSGLALAPALALAHSKWGLRCLFTRPTRKASPQARLQPIHVLPPPHTHR
jgi:hypothetical protein